MIITIAEGGIVIATSAILAIARAISDSSNSITNKEP